MPKGLFARSLLIVILPMLILQSVVAYVFMERHWNLVTRRLSEAVTRDISALISVLETYPQDADYDRLTEIARRDFSLSVSILPPDPLPPPAPKPFFSLLDTALSEEIVRIIGRPFWIDTVGRSDLIEIRIQLEGRVLRVLARRGQAYASNSHIFLVWMVSTSIFLLAIAIVFLRNQIRPIQQLAAAAENFGKGRPVPPDFRPRGAREVRKASQAFVDMRRRIERQIEQRTTMLAGVSHDMRTVLTRFRLQLALIGGGPEVEDLEADIDEMQSMLEAYLAFARGDGDEAASPTDIAEMLRAIAAEADRAGFTVTQRFTGPPLVILRPNAFKRAVGNLVGNACRYAERVEVSARHEDGYLHVVVDDDGPGVPEAERENVFRPFYRLDRARNQDEGGTGLGLAITRDIVRGHGGDVRLEESPLGGLRAILRIPG
ncbi:ATP-binding protein [Prosthecomicrobium sp. N25]|uniref:ATP-binding protein n=1 Tax=Prosthecomicrobium sp. N25 TaxID=3129254 RepID=UPI003077DA20